MAKSNLNKRLADLEKSRELIYGPFSKNLKKIAKVWSVILDKELTSEVPLNPGIPAYKVALCYAAAKIVRASNNYKEDSYDDALAYLVQENELQKPFTENWTEGYSKWKKEKKVFNTDGIVKDWTT